MHPARLSGVVPLSILQSAVDTGTMKKPKGVPIIVETPRCSPQRGISDLSSK